jgi:NADH:ubiquinone oxidoreductase subunit B-like Fe-S oxidoreductase
MVAQSTAEELDVNVEIGGCPPTPGAILEAIGEASQILASDAAGQKLDDPNDSRDDSLEIEHGAAFRTHELNGENA